MRYQDAVTARKVNAPVEPWRKVLLDAVDRINRDGHYKCGQQSHSTAVCAITSISADGRVQVWYEACAKFAAFIGVKHISGIIAWNDAPERTKEQVTAALRSAALGTDIGT